MASLTQRAIGIGPVVGGLHSGYNGMLPNFWTPPDVQVAAGPDHVMEMVNSVGGVWTKAGTQVSIFPLSSFFATGSDYIGDPKLQYDGVSHRWFASVADGAVGSVRLAVSDGSDPRAGWLIYEHKAATICPDQPTLGVSGDKVAISVNDFSACTIGGAFVGVEYWIYNKAELLAGSPAHYVGRGPDATLFSVHPVLALSSTTTQLLVSTGYNNSNVLKLFTVVGVPPAPVGITETDLPIVTTAMPPDAPQRGTSLLIVTDDARVVDAQWFQGVLWVALGDACTPPGDNAVRACLRFIQIDTLTHAVKQDFDLGSLGKYYFYPALTIDSVGDLLVVFGFSSPSDYPGILVTAQGVEDSQGSLAVPSLLKGGTGFEASWCPDNLSCRYGDYFGAAVDPSDPTLIWVGGEYGTSLGWATSISSIRVRADLTFGYAVAGGGSGYQPPTLTYTFKGGELTALLAVQPTTFTADVATTWGVTTVLAGSTPQERWQTSQDPSGTVGTSEAHSLMYYHQYNATFGYTVLFGGSGYAPPSVTGLSFGTYISLGPSGRGWVDAGTPYRYPQVLDGSTGWERWWTPSRSGTVASSAPATEEYRHQYLVTVTVDPADGRGGSVSAVGGWHNATESLRLTVRAAPGWRLQGWAGSGSGSYVGPSESAMVQVDSAINETATFYPGLTITASAGGSVTFSYDGGSGSVLAGTSRTIYVRPGTTVSIAAAPTLFYAFAGWKGVTGHGDKASIVVDSPTNLTADFSLSLYAIATSPYLLISAGAVAIGIVAFVIRRRAHRPPPPPP